MFGETREQLEKKVRDLQVELLHPNAAVRELAEVDHSIRLLNAARVLLAQRAADSRQWARHGFLSPEQWLANRSGTTVRDAKATLDTGEALKALPELEESARAGELSADQTEIIADGAKEDPSAQAQLIDAARKGATIPQLKESAERAKARARAEDAEAAHARIHRARTMYSGTRADGAAYLTLQGTKDSIARFKAIHQPFLEAELRDAAKKAGEREPLDALAFDAAMAMAEAAATGGSGKATVPAKVFVRVDYEAFCRGIVADEEVCELDGFGPVPVSVARRYAENAFVVGLLTRGTEVAKLAHFGRAPNALQRSLIEWGAKRCQILGCDRFHTEIDHGEGWANTRETRADDLRGFCDHHHDLKTYKGYRLAESTIPGKFLLLAPDEPDPPPRR